MAQRTPQEQNSRKNGKAASARPPKKGDPEQVENVPGREPQKPRQNPDRRPDPDEGYRTGRRGPK